MNISAKLPCYNKPLSPGARGVRSSQCHCFLNMAYSYAQMKTDSAMQRCDESYLHALQAAKDTGISILSLFFFFSSFPT